MALTRFARWLLTKTSAPVHAGCSCRRLMEEIAHGRSSLWVCRELVGLYSFAFMAHARESVRITPLLVALVLALVLAGGASVSSLEQAVETWTSVYYIAGTVSLFAHVMSRSTASRTLLIFDEADNR